VTLIHVKVLDIPMAERAECRGLWRIPELLPQYLGAPAEPELAVQG
jgi:hypothetical protein